MIKKKGIAIFDLDGTITNKDTFIDFIQFVYSTPKLYWGLLWNGIFLVLFLFKLYPNYLFKEKIFSYFFQNYSVHELEKNGTIYGKNKLPKSIRPQALKRLKWHQKQNHQIVILTASSRIWLQQWCLDNNFLLIDTVYEVSEDKYTGKIKGKNCWGKEKVNRLQKCINLSDYSISYGYGDSKADHFFLALVDKAFYKPFK